MLLFPLVDMILYGLNEVYNIPWLKFLKGRVKKTNFFQQAFLVHVALNANELSWLRPSLLWSESSAVYISRETG